MQASLVLNLINLSNNVVIDLIRYNTIKGDMTAIEGEEWIMVEPLSTISWTAPRGIASQWEADVR
jgi:hypothetical protein